MDGNRLRLTSSETLSTYGHDSTTYQTEIADFSNVTAHGTAGNGPSYFTVLGRDGRTYEYGNTTDSRVLANGSTASAWMLDKVTDRAGNTMTVAYKTADANLKGMTVPQAISWTPSTYASTSYNYTMQFSYQLLALAPTAGYLAGTAKQNFYSLANIQIESSGTTVKNYVLGYTASSSTDRQTLTSIKECADAAATNCLLPTAINYQNGVAGVSSSPSTVATNATRYIWTYDFNGDGRDDVLYADSGNNLYVAFGSATGFATPVATGITLTNQSNGYEPAYPFTIAGDVHGSGRASILTVVSGNWWEYAWSSTTGSFVGTNTNLALNTATEAIAALVDINGDGLLDLV
jgi:hypothetical protein